MILYNSLVMGINDSSPLKGNAQCCAGSLSNCPTGDLQNSSKTTDTCVNKNTAPLELDKDLVKRIMKNSKHRKRKGKPIIHYRPLFSWDSQVIDNKGSYKEQKLIDKRQMFQPQSSFNIKGMRRSLPTAAPDTPQLMPTPLSQRSPSPKSTSTASNKHNLRRLDLQPLCSQFAFTESHTPQTNFEITYGASKTSARQDLKARSLYFDFKPIKKGLMCEKGSGYKRLQSKMLNEIAPLTCRKPTLNTNTNSRSSLLKEENLISSITRLNCVIRDEKELPRIKRMNAFADKEETKAAETAATNEASANTDNIAFVLHRRYRQKEKEKRLKNTAKPAAEVTSNAEKRRLWVGGNGKFDSDRLRSWYDKMHNVF
eukprot:TRINITY_DN1714_c0_g4_i1.p1 TRINITY_DN1714_c0_g4~~TRINITY_DN1714_c0_g4_i1.p1  ORF type:complete len:370 (-),score=70.00 TRINITY_DN1714_c0_g4_i1:168-1277(-)